MKILLLLLMSQVVLPTKPPGVSVVRTVDSIAVIDSDGYTCRGKFEIWFDGGWKELPVPTCVPPIQWTAAKPIPAKPWTPQVCKEQRKSLTTEYLHYCITSAPSIFPNCSVNDESPSQARDAAIAGKGSAYFEVLDCSWHPGVNPRDKSRTK
jgi:hypothetical protein